MFARCARGFTVSQKSRRHMMQADLPSASRSFNSIMTATEMLRPLLVPTYSSELNRKRTTRAQMATLVFCLLHPWVSCYTHLIFATPLDCLLRSKSELICTLQIPISDFPPRPLASRHAEAATKAPKPPNKLQRKRPSTLQTSYINIRLDRLVPVSTS